MDDLITWLRARLDEDEAIARAAGAASWSVGTEETMDGENAFYSVSVDGSGADEWFVDVEVNEHAKVEHIARHDPARVLREVEAKRRLIDEHASDEVASLERSTRGELVAVCRRCAVTTTFSRVVAPCPTLKLLALPFSDRPGYREEWKP